MNGTRAKKKGNFFKKLVLTLLMIYLFLPVFATFLYSISTRWESTILPTGITFERYVSIFENVRFLEAIGRSLLVSSITIVLSLIIVIPTVFIIVTYFPKFERFMQILALLPFAFPPIVVSVGLINVYSSGPIVITGTIWILIGAYFVLIIPFMYQGIRNSLRTVNAIDLMEAAEMLGASKLRAFFSIIVPNILPGIMISGLLSFAVLLGEFVYVNIMVGGRFETIQIYVYSMMTTNGHMTSVMITLLFVLLFALSGIIVKLGKGQPGSNANVNAVGNVWEEEK